MKQTIQVTARVFTREECEYGTPTGRAQWICEPISATFNGKRTCVFMAVLGRWYSRDDAISDWKFRAQNERDFQAYDFNLQIVD